MSTIRGMFTNPHDACLLATYLMDMTIVITKTGWKYVDKSGTTFVDDFDNYLKEHNNEWPPLHTIGRISIMCPPKTYSHQQQQREPTWLTSCEANSRRREKQSRRMGYGLMGSS